MLWKKICCCTSSGFTSPSKTREALPWNSRGIVWHQSEGIVKSSSQWQPHSRGFLKPRAAERSRNVMAAECCFPCASAMRLHQWNTVVCVISISLPFSQSNFVLVVSRNTMQSALPKYPQQRSVKGMKIRNYACALDF